MQISIHAATGNYDGKYLQRVYLLDVHQPTAPKKISVNGEKLKVYSSAAKFAGAKTGCYFDAAAKNGTVHIKTNYLKTDADQVVSIIN